jgi:hypothetical protein
MGTTTTLPIVARSALRHRPISQPGTDDILIVPVTPTARASRTLQRKPSKARPHAQTRPATVPAHAQQSPFALHWTVHCGLAMLVMVLLLWIGQLVWMWGIQTYNDIHYGRPRTIQVDAFVGHEKGNIPSHFIALNNHGQIEIIEMPGDDASQARVFFAQHFSGPQADLIPVSLQFSDPQHTRHPDMIVSAQQSQVLFKNEHGTFVAASNQS